MATETVSPPLQKDGYRRTILVFAALWGAVPALGPLFAGQFGLSQTQAFAGIGGLMTISLGLLYELDSRSLAKQGYTIPYAWVYALVVPISFVIWGLAVAVIPQVAFIGILVGPPASALLYLWQRGKQV